MADCLGNYITSYSQHYPTYSSNFFARRADMVPQMDEALISNQFQNTLQVKGMQIKSKVWPSTSFGVEEYKDYLKRLQCCKKELYKLYFRCPCVKPDYIERMLYDLEKSTYQIVYSPNVFVSRKESRRYAKTAHIKTNMKHYETTYGTYYNRIAELESFKDLLFSKLSKKDKEQLNSDLRKTYKTGLSTYHVDLCEPAIEMAKCAKVPAGPIDRYTLRRI